MMKTKLSPTGICLALALWAIPAPAHNHFEAGVLDADGDGNYEAGEPLCLVNDDGTQKTFHLLPRAVGQPAGGRYVLDESPRDLHQNDGFSFIVQSNGDYDVAGPEHPHAGAWIWMEIVSVHGPEGGTFAFWDENRALVSATPSRVFPANQPVDGFAFVLSEGPDTAGEDPHGHIHGRTWTADKAGDYRIGFRLVDRSTNRPGGGPWHPPSQVYFWNFRAGPEFRIKEIATSSQGFRITWPSRMGLFSEFSQPGMRFDILRSPTLKPGSWEKIGEVIGTTADTISFLDSEAPLGTAYYRLAYDWNFDSIE